jgi:hypothetical protein
MCGIHYFNFVPLRIHIQLLILLPNVLMFLFFFTFKMVDNVIIWSLLASFGITKSYTHFVCSFVIVFVLCYCYCLYCLIHYFYFIKKCICMTIQLLSINVWYSTHKPFNVVNVVTFRCIFNFFCMHL